jgi:hypothetical protein
MSSTRLRLGGVRPGTDEQPGPSIDTTRRRGVLLRRSGCAGKRKCTGGTKWMFDGPAPAMTDGPRRCSSPMSESLRSRSLWHPAPRFTACGESSKLPGSSDVGLLCPGASISRRSGDFASTPSPFRRRGRRVHRTLILQPLSPRRRRATSGSDRPHGASQFGMHTTDTSTSVISGEVVLELDDGVERSLARRHPVRMGPITVGEIRAPNLPS